jgi:hypothetical protein
LLVHQGRHLQADPQSGEVVFIGTLDGGPVGTFATTYMFEGKYDP